MVTVWSGRRGFRASRLFLRILSKVPKPTRETFSPLATVSRMTPIVASMTRATSALFLVVRLETSPTSPLLFTLTGTVSAWRPVVNASVRGDNGGVSKRVIVLVAGGCMLPACGGGAEPPVRYYDPFGYFSARLPGSNQIQILSPQLGGEPALLSGVDSRPVPPGPPPAGGGRFAAQTQGDTTTFRVHVFDASRIESLEDFSLLHTRTPRTDLDTRAGDGGEPRRAADRGRHTEETGEEFGAASAFAIVTGNVGYWVLAVFGPGSWERQQGRFFDILRSLRPGVPAGLEGIPLALEAA